MIYILKRMMSMDVGAGSQEVIRLKVYKQDLRQGPVKGQGGLKQRLNVSFPIGAHCMPISERAFSYSTMKNRGAPRY